MIWKNMTAQERIAFCKSHPMCMVETLVDWDKLSPTSQMLLKCEGIEDKAIYEV